MSLNPKVSFKTPLYEVLKFILSNKWVTFNSIYLSPLLEIFSSSALDIFICMWNLELQQPSFKYDTNKQHTEHDRVEK